jgi:hypothetical protein
MKKHFLLSTSLFILLLTTGCSLWDQWINDKPVPPSKPPAPKQMTVKQNNLGNTTIVDQKKIPEILAKANTTQQKAEKSAYQLQGLQKLTTAEGPINENALSLRGNEAKNTNTLHLTGTINDSKKYEVWKSDDMIYEKMTSEWLERKTSQAKRSPFDTLTILNQAMDSFENTTHTKGLTLKEEKGNYIVSASKKFLDQNPTTKNQMTQYIHEGMQTALSEANSNLKLNQVNIKKFVLIYEINAQDYQYFKIKMNLSYDYTLNGKTFGVEEQLEKANKGTFNGSLKVPAEVTNENTQSEIKNQLAYIK